MGRPASGLDEYLDWQERLESYKASGLSVDEFCLSEGIAKSTYYRWLDRLKNGLPEEMVEEAAARKRIESGGAVFVPISLKASPVEIELHPHLTGKHGRRSTVAGFGREARPFCGVKSRSQRKGSEHE